MTQEKPRTGRVQRWLLVGSLALNLAVVGIVAGSFWKGGPDGRGSRLDLSIGPLTRAMDSDDRAALRESLRGTGIFRAGDRAAIRSDMATLVDVLRADTFDPVAFRDVLGRQRARLQEGQDQVLDAITTQIEGMSPAARAGFADRLAEQLSRGPEARDTNSRDDRGRHAPSGG